MSREPASSKRPSHEADCLFCNFSRDADRVTERSVHFFARLDSFPVSRGHTLIISNRHVLSPFELREDEWCDFYEILAGVYDAIEAEYSPDGYNVGINVGSAGGQTVAHLHIHVIPRYEGDVRDPAGGVRKIVPNLVSYP